MSNLEVYAFGNHEVRTIIINHEPHFVLRDICAALGLTTPARVAERLDKDEVSQTHITDPLGRPQDTTIINESGLYSVILRSDKPEAKAFKKWVTSEVLPTIRKTGSYSLQPTQPASPLALAETMLEALKQQDTRLQALEDWKDTAPINSAQIAVIHRLGQRLGHLIG